MTENINEIIQKITKEKKFNEILVNLSKDILESMAPKKGYRFATENEKSLIIQAIQEKNFLALKDLYLHKVDLNSVFYLSDGEVLKLFFVAASLTDEEYIEFINVLNDCDYNFDIRNYATGSSALLSMILTFNYKAAKRLVELGVNVNGTNLSRNRTLNSVYDTKDLPKDIHEMWLEMGRDISNIKKDEELIAMIKEAGYDEDAKDPLLEEIFTFVGDFCQKNNYDDDILAGLEKTMLGLASRTFENILKNKL